MFATTIPNGGPGTSSGSTSRNSMRSSASPFNAAPRRAASSATGSFSVPHTRPAARSAAPMARIPLPVPMSRTSAPGRSASNSSIRSRQSAVVGWLPVPNAIPGSIAMRTTPAPAAGTSQGGCTSTRGPMRSGLWCARQARVQSCSGTSTGTTSERCSSAAASSAAERSVKYAMHRPRPSGNGGVPGMSSCPGSCNSTPAAPRSKRSEARISSSSTGAEKTSRKLTSRQLGRHCALRSDEREDLAARIEHLLRGGEYVHPRHRTDLLGETGGEVGAEPIRLVEGVDRGARRVPLQADGVGADEMRPGAIQLGRRGRRLAATLELAADALQRLLHLLRSAADVDGEGPRIDALDREARHAVGQAPLVPSPHQAPAALAGEHRREHLQRPAQRIGQPRSEETDDEVRLRLVELLHRAAGRGGPLLLRRPHRDQPAIAMAAEVLGREPLHLARIDVADHRENGVAGWIPLLVIGGEPGWRNPP